MKFPNPTPLEKTLAWEVIEESTKSTPDWLDLKACFKEEFLVFVTGNSRKKYWRNYEMKGCNYYGMGLTWDNSFVMKRSNSVTQKNSDPIVFHLDDKAPWHELRENFVPEDRACLEGDVYGVPLRRLANIDLREGNGESMQRIERWVRLIHPIQGEKAVRCFMYVADLDFFMEYFSHATPLKNCNTVSYPPNGKNVTETKAYYAPQNPLY